MPTDFEDEIRQGYERGWCFTPLYGKRPFLTDWQNFPRHTLDQVIAWSRRFNIGLRTGINSGIGVIDIDPGATMRPQDFPRTATAVTGGGGHHLYYKVDRAVKNSQSDVAPSVDVRGDGGQVVFVGSKHHVTQKVYAWFPGLSPNEIALADFPYSMLPTRLPLPPSVPPLAPTGPMGDSEKRAMAYLAKCDDAISGAGGHNATLRVACECRRFGLNRPSMLRVMDWFNSNKCSPPWSVRELEHKVDSAITLVDADGRFGVRLQERPSHATYVSPRPPPPSRPAPPAMGPPSRPVPPPRIQTLNELETY